MIPALRVQQGAIRKAIEALPSSATGDDFAKILVEEAGVGAEEIVEVGAIAAAAPGGLAWLSEFWSVAPWIPEEEEEVEEGDLPFKKPEDDGKTEAPEVPPAEG